MSPPEETERGDDRSREASVRALRQRALGLLARREHSRRELERKLLRRGEDPDELREVLAALAGEGLLSESRYAEQRTRSLAERGYGSRRVAAELRERGLAGELVTRSLAGEDWTERAREARRRRFGAEPPADRGEWLRQARFLAGRGFAESDVRRALAGVTDDE
ncbi:MAG: regulatory protein RecX [Ectothiorhodospiraceae bacterium]|nr:regulatory protein RecX [Chromatiales bacterium]MCP5153987.1 regulatory protein RecX [Ectothiorhodospiraceae bacterium]